MEIDLRNVGKVEYQGAECVTWDDKRLVYRCRGAVKEIPGFVVDWELDHQGADSPKPLSDTTVAYSNLTPSQRHFYIGWLNATYKFNPLPTQPYLLLHLSGIEHKVSSGDVSSEELNTIFDFLCGCHYACLHFASNNSQYRKRSFLLLKQLGFQLRREMSQEFAFIFCCELRNLHRNGSFGTITLLKTEFKCDWKRFVAARNCRSRHSSDHLPFTAKGAQTSDEWCESLKESTLHPLLRELKLNHKSREEALKTKDTKVELPTPSPEKPKKNRRKKLASKIKTPNVSSPKPLQLGSFGLLLHQAAKESNSSLSKVVQESREKIE